MMSKIRKATKGFTLIELLVVIAIIGLLASIVLVSLTSARSKARDSRRIGDLRQLQLALELYFDSSTSGYPDSAVAGTPVAVGTGWANVLTSLVPAYMSSVPSDPRDTDGTGTGGGTYQYTYVTEDDSTSDTAYAMSARLESIPNTALDNDLDGATYDLDAAGGNLRTIDCGDTNPFYCVRN